MNLFTTIPAILAHVVLMPNALTEYVHAYLNIRATLTEGVDLNVFLIPIAQETRLVLETNVLIPVLVHVVKTPYVKYLAMFPCAVVQPE